ncbi:MAG: hypothetical protein WCT37_05440 [Patescibacteria group bacterium]|jgi:hypothetical protein
MTTEQIDRFLAALQMCKKAFFALSNQDAQWVIQHTREAIALFVEAVRTRPRLDKFSAAPADSLRMRRAKEHFATCPPWKTIKLGTGLRIEDDFRIVLEERGFAIDSSAGGIMCQADFQISDHECEVDLVLASSKDLVLNGDARLSDMFARAKEFGLEICLPEVGPQLRLQWPDQRPGIEQYLHVAMRPIKDQRYNDVGPAVFVVENARNGVNNRILRLSADFGGMGSSCGHDATYIFCRPRRTN